jgi:DNA repair protein RadC
MQQILLREHKIDQNREHFWVIGLENNNRILFIELISLGSVNSTIAEPMEVFSLALQKRAVKIILCHNHPSGELEASDLDRDITDRLIQVGKIVKTPVIDHLIISEQGFLSFDEAGLMSVLEKSTKYVPSYVLEEMIRQEADFLARRNEKLDIAKAMKKAGEPIDKIALFTSLTKEEIEGLE